MYQWWEPHALEDKIHDICLKSHRNFYCTLMKSPHHGMQIKYIADFQDGFEIPKETIINIIDDCTEPPNITTLPHPSLMLRTISHKPEMSVRTFIKLLKVTNWPTWKIDSDKDLTNGGNMNYWCMKKERC